MRRWLFACALLGCGDNLVDESVDEHGGTQLRLPWYEYPDGARERVGGFFDSKLDATCELIEWADGATRCTPGVDLSEEPKYATVAFGDAACTDAVGTTTRDREFAILESDGRPAALFRGSETFRNVVELYRRDASGCMGPFFSDSVVFELGRSIAPADLVWFEERVLPSTGRLAHVVRAGSDGTQKWRGFHDTKLGFDCWESDGVCWPEDVPIDATIDVDLAPIEFVVEPAADRRLADHVAVAGQLRGKANGLFDTDADAWCSAIVDWAPGEPRCVPASCCGVEDAFADSTCTTQIQVTRRPGDWDFYRYAYERSGYRELLDPIDAFVRASTGECVPFGRPPGYNVHALGAPRPRDEFLPATLVVE